MTSFVSLFLVISFVYQVIPTPAPGAPEPQYIFWAYDHIDSLSGFTSYNTFEVVGVNSRLRIYGGGYIYTTSRTNTVGYHHIHLEFQLSLSGDSALDWNEFAVLKYQIDNYNWIQLQQYDQNALTSYVVELPESASNNNIGIRIRLENSGSHPTDDSFYVRNLFRLTGTIITDSPTANPTTHPTHDPTNDPSADPTQHPTSQPTTNPTIFPTYYPSTDPTYDPSTDPTTNPTFQPTYDPTPHPTYNPTTKPTYDPTTEPTMHPTYKPSATPTTATPTRTNPTTTIYATNSISTTWSTIYATNSISTQSDDDLVKNKGDQDMILLLECIAGGLLLLLVMLFMVYVSRGYFKMKSKHNRIERVLSRSDAMAEMISIPNGNTMAKQPPMDNTVTYTNTNSSDILQQEHGVNEISQINEIIELQHAELTAEGSQKVNNRQSKHRRTEGESFSTLNINYDHELNSRSNDLQLADDEFIVDDNM